MSSYDYRFETCWRVPGRLEEVTEILADAPGFTRWWPQVYLTISEPEPGIFVVQSKGWLPYTLSWNLRVVESRSPYGFTIQAWGDLEGVGVWSFEPDGDWTEITYVWNVRARKPLLRSLSLFLRPLFSANHRWAMARGRESLVRELSRRRSEKEFRAVGS
jgi:hypothetical protein